MGGGVERGTRLGSQSVFESLESRRLLAAATGPLISEFVASNGSGLMDADGDHSDWIELHNPTGAPVTLDGWGLTDNATRPAKWTFPDNRPTASEVVLPAGGRLVVFASGKDRRIAGQDLHTNFSLSADGEYLGLIPPGGAPAFEYAPTFPAQTRDVSYGVLEGDANARRYFTTPTPRAAEVEGVIGFVAEPRFSVERGFYDAPFDVEITTATAGAAIRYTTDGSPPSATTGTLYTGPVSISKTTTLRAVAYRDGFATPGIDTHTYLFLDQVIRQPATVPGWPNPQFGTPWDMVLDYEMDPRVVDAPAYSDVIRTALTDIPTMSLVVRQSDGWNADGTGGFYRQEDVEVPVSVEVIFPHDPSKNVQADGGIESHSHEQPKRSLRLNFRARYGDSKLTTTLMKDAPLNGNGAVDSFDRLLLRAGHNRSWLWGGEAARLTTYAEDQWVRDTQLALTGEGARGTFVHLYINGLYWGLYNPSERPDEHFTSAYFGGDDEQWLAVSHSGVKDGDPTRWGYLEGPLKDKDMAVLANYRELEQYLDTTNFIDYLLAHFYAGVIDWPYNNFWAGNRNDVQGPTKFFAWDAESSFGSEAGSPSEAWVHPDFHQDRTKAQGTVIPQIFNSAQAGPEFRMLLADRAYRATANGGALTDAAARERWITLNTFIENAIVAESARWGDAGQPEPLTRDVEWLAEVARKRDNMVGNADHLIAALRAQGYYPATDPAAFSQRGGMVPAGFNLHLKDLNRSSGTIYYTLDGSDPREVGGGVAPAAIPFSAGEGVALNASATVRVRVRSSDGEWSAIDAVTFTVVPANAPPAISQHPAAANVPVGEPATFIVEAVGTGPLSYQWKRNGTAVHGATSASYTLPSAAAVDHGSTFAAVVTNAAGSAASAPASLAVISVIAPGDEPGPGGQALGAAPSAVLAVSGVASRVPAVVVAGDVRAKGSIALTLTNISGGPFAGPLTVAVRASAEGEANEPDLILVSRSRNLTLKPGASHGVRLKFTFPQHTPAGTRTVLVTADAAGASNSAAGPQVEVQPPFVRLTGPPAPLPAPRPLAFGRRATFAVHIQNAGNVPTSRTPATHTLLVSGDGTDLVYEETGATRVSLKPGASRTVPLRITFPPGAFEPGSYGLLVRLSTDLNETNGETLALISFTIA